MATTHTKATYAAMLLMGTALVAAPALAQTSTPAPAATTQAPAAMGAGAADKVVYMRENNPNVWRASKLEGVDVYNDRNEKIGDIAEVLLDRDGKVEAVIIAVGGFLGIGERHVAVAFNALQWQMTDRPAATAPATAPRTATPRTTTPGTTTAPPAATTAPRPATTADRNRDAPARVVLPGATKEQLENAPEFKYAS